jgi:hypothetical protein
LPSTRHCDGRRSTVALLRFKVFEELPAIADLFANAASAILLEV